MSHPLRFLSTLPIVLLALTGCGGDEFSSDGSGGSGSGSGGSAPVGTCADVCDTRSALACAGETPASCQSECTYWKELVRWCDLVGDAYLTCLADEPVESFGCADDENAPGPLHIRQGICATAQQAILDCWYEGPAGGIPAEVQTACETMCANMASLDCKSPTCADDCLLGLDATKSCNGSWAAYVECAAKQPAESWKCNLTRAPELGGACGEYWLLIVACQTAS